MRRLLSLLFACIIVLGCALPAGAGTIPAFPFKDVKHGDWFFDAVNYAYEHRLFSGVKPDTFNPKGTMTRGMFVTVLSNLSHAYTGRYTQQHFVDVPLQKWYGPSVEWAAGQAIVSGTGPFQFRPEDPITREQMVSMLYRFAQATGNDTKAKAVSTTFSDYDQVSRYARPAVEWALGAKLLQGTGPRTLTPKGTATRAQAAQLLYCAQDVLKKTRVTAEPMKLPLPDEVDFVLYNMTLQEKVGQLFLPRYPSGSVSSLTKRLTPAGFVLFGVDFKGKTKGQVQAMIESCQAASPLPLLIAADEEGGTVVRVSSNPLLAEAPFKAPQKIYKSGGLEALTADTEKKAELLLGLGVNLNLAPVCDVSTSWSDFMYSRSMGVPAEETAEAIRAIVTAMEEKGISGALKHFPGYGNNVDTHTGISLDKRPLSQFREADFLPFSAGIEAGAPSVLVSHNIVACMDKERPASLSKAVHDLLRDELGFEGVIITDDLSMDAIKLYTGGQSPAVAAFLAGNDLLLTSDWEQDYKALLAAAQDGTVPLTQVEASVRRVLLWKQEKGLL